MKPEIIHVEETSSTMENARKLVQNDAKNFDAKRFSAIYASRQTKGRGRRGREWFDGRGNLMATILVHMNDMHVDRQFLPYVVSLALVNVFNAQLPGGKANIKWPNDILINEKKIAGILIENDAHSGFAMVGIGVNLVTAPKETNFKFQPTCLKELTKKTVLPAAILQNIIDELKALCQTWKRFGFNRSLIETYHAHLWRFGSQIEISNNESPSTTGINSGLAADGGLQLKQSHMTKTFYVGDLEP